MQTFPSQQKEPSVSRQQGSFLRQDEAASAAAGSKCQQTFNCKNLSHRRHIEVNYLRRCGPSSRGMCPSSWGVFLFAYRGLLREKRWFHDLTYITWKDSRCPLPLFCMRSNSQAQRPLCTGNKVCGWLQQFLHLGPDGSIHNCKGVRRRRRRAKGINTRISIPEYLACHISHHRWEKQYNYELIGCKNAVSCQP